MKTLAIASLSALILLSGCNTFKGFGQDVAKAGDGVTKAADKVETEVEEKF